MYQQPFVKRTFSIQNLIKTQVRNKLESKNLKAMLRIALEGPDENFGNIIKEAISLWKNGVKYRFLYANPSRYVFSAYGAFCSVTSVMLSNSNDIDV